MSSAEATEAGFGLTSWSAVVSFFTRTDSVDPTLHVVDVICPSIWSSSSDLIFFFSGVSAVIEGEAAR
jgi:hypothetical protein